MDVAFVQSFIPETVLALGRLVIEHYNNRDEAIDIPAWQNTHGDLYLYRWNDPTINLLGHILEDRFTRSRFYQRQYNAFWTIMIMGDAELLYLFLKYGFLNVRVLEEYPEVRYDVTEDQPRTLTLFENWRELKFTREENLKRLYEPLCHFDFLNTRSHYACVSQRRLGKALWGLEAIVRNRSIKARTSKVLCLKTFYQFVREPYITTKEITDIVKHTGGENMEDSVVEDIVKAFDMYFPENGEIYEPRSLQHLCACQIRESLYKTSRYPEGVEHLQLPLQYKHSVLPILELRPKPQRIQMYRYSPSNRLRYQVTMESEDRDDIELHVSYNWQNEW